MVRSSLVALLLATPSTSAADSSPTELETPDLEIELAPPPAPDLERGATLYRQRCAVCHGPEGRGDGAVARLLDPRPRDLGRGIYKLRSTATGQLPTDTDIFRTLTRGIPGTAMPPWSGLDEADRWQLVFFVKSLSPRFAEVSALTVVTVPAPRPATAETVRRGAAVYRAMGCYMCHGDAGRGDGASAQTLVDDSGRPIRAFDMTRAWKLKGGTEAADVYRTFHTGLDGTPMPAYQGVLSEADSWALTHFVRSLFVDR